MQNHIDVGVGANISFIAVLPFAVLERGVEERWVAKVKRLLNDVLRVGI